jgi:ribosome-binding factor A
LRGVKDPRVNGVTLTGVSISPDLKVAKVYFTTRRKEEEAEALVGLRSATGYIKRQIAHHLRLRHMPDLHFLYDTTLENANRVESLLRQVAEKKESEPQ